MKTFVFSLLLFLAPLSAESKNRKFYLQEIKSGIDKILAGIDKNVHVGIEVISLDSGLRLYEKNAQQLFVPASLTKLFVAGAALSKLGPQFTFETALLTDGAIKQKALRGNLYLQGSGDPSFSLADLEELVLQLRLHQIEEIQGDLIIDNYAFDNISEGPGWMWDDINGVSYAPMNALSLNHNLVQVWVKPAEGVATPPKVFVYPRTPFLQIKNLATTDEKADTLSVERTFKGKKNTILVKGEIGVRSGIRAFQVPIKNPHLYAATLLQSICKKAGVECKGTIKVRRTPPSAFVLATHHSPSLANLIRIMLKSSDNLYADNLFKRIGLHYDKEQGTWKTGSQAIRSHLEKDAGLEIADLVLLDGSGLSRYNLVSAHQITSYLAWAHKKSHYAPEFVSALSLAGRDGGLANRFAETDFLLRGKTGTMSGITTLAGYVYTADNEPLAFAILINGFTDKAAKYKAQIEDPIALFLSKITKH